MAKRASLLVSLTARAEGWWNPDPPRRLAVALAVAGLLAMVAAVVYLTGGTSSAYPHLAYVPILLGGVCFGLAGGVVTGAVAGLALGPLMPLDVAAGLPQATASWLTRGAFFLLVGTIAGLMSAVLGAQLAAIRRHGFHDPLTDLPNKPALHERLAQAIAAAPEGPHALVALHVTPFERINAAFGFETSDALLEAVAERLLAVAGDGAAVHHLHAAHFALVCPGADHARADALVARVLDALEGPFVVAGLPLHVEARAGLAHHPDHGASPRVLLSAATFALQQATEQERERASYDLATHQAQKRALHLLTDLHRAIEDEQLFLVYQPRLCLRTGALLGVEALARWRHPTEGLVSPVEFAAIAEETALVHPFTLWVARTAIAQLAAWREAPRQLSVSINVSARNLEDPAFPDDLHALLAAHGIEHGLEIEVTERSVMCRHERVLAALGRLRGHGVAVAIDDFGTGQSSLAYLRDLPVDALKIDRSFIRGLPQGARNATIVGAIVDLAHDLDLLAVAEGVEDAAALDQLRVLGCDQAQGFVIGRPMPADAIEAWLASRHADRAPVPADPPLPVPG